MGHERTGALPRTKRWRGLLAQITASSQVAGDAFPIEAIARRTLENVAVQYSKLCDDSGVQAGFTFLLALTRPESHQEASAGSECLVDVSTNPSLVALVASLAAFVKSRGESPEYGAIATRAAADTVVAWVKRHPQETLFGPISATEIWARAGTASGFSELARLFLARFTDRYLRYLLDRELSASLPDVATRERFNRTLSEHVEGLSRHAFETAQIAQSFAAGWYGKHATRSMPSSREIRSFLSIAFGKLSEELKREREADG